MAHICRLPALKSQVEDQIAKCDEEFERLPTRLTSNPVDEAYRLISTLCTLLNNVIHGTADDKSFIQKNRATYRLFKRAIFATVPDFRPLHHNLDWSDYKSPLEEDNTVDSDTAYVQPMNQPITLIDVRRVIEK